MNNSLITDQVLCDVADHATGATSKTELLPIILAALKRAELNAYEVTLSDWKRLLVIAVRAARTSSRGRPDYTRFRAYEAPAH